MITFQRSMFATLLFVVSIFTGPARAQAPEVVPAAPATAPPADTAYTVGPGDTVNVQVYGEPGLSGAFPVDASGGLDFPLIGRVQVGGLAPPAVTELLRARLTEGYLRNPNLTVSVSSFRSQPVQVLGAVAKPGLYYLRGPTTVMAILSEAGGVSTTGVGEVRITHHGEQSASVVVPYDQLLTAGTDTVTLRGGDIVFVPQSMVTVMGSVAKPGEVPFREGLTVTQAIAGTGGALPVAALGGVYVLRGEERIRVNLRRVLSGKSPDVTLRAGDKLFVPESAI